MYISSRNPEFARNIWLELTPGRLIVMPVILALTFAAVSTFDGVRSFSILAFMILANIYATKLATESIVSELNTKTWDNLRLTLIHPLSMATGKLFGSTIYAWYGAIISILIFFVYSFLNDDLLVSFRFGIWAILFSLFTQVFAMIYSLMGIRKHRDKSKISWFFYFLISVGISYYLQGFMYFSFFSSQFELLRNELSTIYWYFIPVNIFDFMIISTIVFILWAIYGLKNLIRLEFNYRNKSTAWIAFLLFLTLYFFGLGISVMNLNYLLQNFLGGFQLNNINGVWSALFIPLMFIVLLNYFLIFNENHNIIDYKKLLFLLKEKNFKELTYITPLWITTFLFLIILGLVFQIIAIINFISFKPIDTNIDNLRFGLFIPLNILLFTMRDFAIVAYFNIGKKFRRPDVAALVSIYILYFVLNPVINAVFGEIDINLLSPFYSGNSFIITLSITIQAGLMIVLTVKTYKKKVGNFSIGQI